MFLDMDYFEIVEEEAVDKGRIIEVDKYLALPQMRALLPSGAEANPLDWWLHEPALPHLAKMARQFLALSASSAGPERLFHAVGRLHDDQKKSTKDNTIEHILNVYANT